MVIYYGLYRCPFHLPSNICISGDTGEMMGIYRNLRQEEYFTPIVGGLKHVFFVILKYNH